MSLHSWMSSILQKQKKAWSDMQTPLCVHGIGQISSEYMTLGPVSLKGTLTLSTHPAEQEAKGI